MGLEAPGDCSDQFGYNKMLVLVCEGPKPPSPMISWFLSLGEPLFIDFNTQKCFKNMKKHKHLFQPNIFINIKMLDICNFELLDQVWKRRAPTNDEDPSKKISKIWLWEQYLPENKKWKFGHENRNLRNFQHFEILELVNFWSFECSKVFQF